MTQEDVNMAFEEKVKKRIFDPVSRFLTDASTSEDRLQTALCLTWLMFSVYALNKGKILSDGILVHHCKLRAVDLDRNFCPADGRIRCQDVLDPRPFRDGHVKVHRLEHHREPDRASEIAYAEAMAIRPERKWNSALDLESWIEEQTSFDQVLLGKKMEGHTLSTIAEDLGVSLSVVDYRSKKLGHELAARAGITIKDRRAQC